MKNKILTASDMGKLSHQKMKEKLGEEGYREMQLKKSLQAKVARELKKRFIGMESHLDFDKQLKENKLIMKLKKTVDKSVVEQTVDSKI